MKHSVVNFTHNFYFRGHLCISLPTTIQDGQGIIDEAIQQKILEKQVQASHEELEAPASQNYDW